MGWLLPTLTQLKTKLDRIKPSLKFSKPLVDAIQLGLKNRFSEILEDPELIAAAILLPKFKMSWTKDEAILKKVESYLGMEDPVFFELRVRYLLASERIQEAVALAKSCIEHPEVGRHLYFHQAYLTCLLKASLFDHLHKEIAEINGKDAVEIICNSEKEQRYDLLLALCKAFLTQQLQNGNMYYIWDLIFIWSKLHLRAKPSKQDFLEECHQLMLSATNVKSIFPFMKVIRAELENEGLQFCVELCARALQMHHDPTTKLLIYKTIAFLLPNDLEVCRACALLVFFLERTVESYKMVYHLYTHPDQEYQDYSVVKTHIRFEILQILKKGLSFDPEFWNLITLRTNCLKLMSEKVMQAALSEMMEEDKWIPNYCVKEPSKLLSDAPDCHTNQLRRHPVKKASRSVKKRIVVPPEVVGVSLGKRRGRKPGSRVIRVMDDSQLRRSFRQLDMAQEISVRQHENRQQRLLARQGEKITLKRRGRKPCWLLQETAKQAENSSPRHIGRPGRKILKKKNPPNMESKLPDYSMVQTDKDIYKAQEVSIEETNSDVELTPLLPAAETANEETAKLQKQELPLLSITLPDDPLTAVPVTMLEVTISDNEVMDTFSEEQLQDHELQHYPVPGTGDDSIQMVQINQAVGKSVTWKRKDSQHASDFRLKVRKESTKPEAVVPAYLDECYISMPKRRKPLPADSSSPVGQSEPGGKAQRRRCSKCFSSFDTVEALQSHLSLNKCMSLFGFDSDEETGRTRDSKDLKLLKCGSRWTKNHNLKGTTSERHFGPSYKALK
ncbi:hypothetical protein AAFF_G00242950 [Aldrovandia affinis]|uniref:Zinc finger protein Rlf/292/654 TPR repeats domain-containing protein n=1 Tax=Aldrovandia affinis TaxID=143900 RepID=A0AAD7RDX1_9TELE|nr:hypothetical protein AAFF_G00242950 [Aldrovandia affinis]